MQLYPTKVHKLMSRPTTKSTCGIVSSPPSHRRPSLSCSFRTSRSRTRTPSGLREPRQGSPRFQRLRLPHVGVEIRPGSRSQDRYALRVSIDDVNHPRLKVDSPLSCVEDNLAVVLRECPAAIVREVPRTSYRPTYGARQIDLPRDYRALARTRTQRTACPMGSRFLPRHGTSRTLDPGRHP